jgi:hypothetical protein
MKKEIQKATASRRRASKEPPPPVTGEITNAVVAIQEAVEVQTLQDPEKWPSETSLSVGEEKNHAAPRSNKEIERIEHRLVTLLAISASDIKDLKEICQRMHEKMEHMVNENNQLREELHDEIQSRVRETRKEVVAYVERKIFPLKEDLAGKMEHNSATLKTSFIEDLKKQRKLMFLMFILAMLASAGVFLLGQG